MKRTISILSLIICFSFSSEAQIIRYLIGNPWSKGEIITTEGIKKGLVKAPKSPRKNKVKFKLNKKARSEKISKDIIKKIIIGEDEEHGHVFEVFPYAYGVITDDYNPRTTNRSYFVYKTLSGYYNLYQMPDEYKMKKNGKLILITSEGSAQFMIGKDGDKIIYQIISYGRYYKKALEYWLGDCDAVVKEYNIKKNLRRYNPIYFVNIYNEHKKK